MATATARTAAANPNGAPAPVNRMTLDQIRKGTGPKPDRILLMGTEGVGKTTFAADAPNPIFLCAEDGLPDLLDHVQRFPEPQSFQDARDAVRTLIREDHDFKTLAIDTIDWLEPLVWREVCARNNWANIEEPGYGKGFLVAGEEWRKLLADLDTLRQRKGMWIILLAHASIRTFTNPAGGDYSRYECKLNKHASALVKEWTDVNLFAIHEEFAQTKNGKETRKGVSTGRRVVHTERTAAWDAKNRYALPPELPLNFADYLAARAAGEPADPAKLFSEGEQLIASLPIDDTKKKETLAWLQAQREKGAAVLARGVDRLRSKVAEMGGE